MSSGVMSSPSGHRCWRLGRGGRVDDEILDRLHVVSAGTDDDLGARNELDHLLRGEDPRLAELNGDVALIGLAGLPTADRALRGVRRPEVCPAFRGLTALATVEDVSPVAVAVCLDEPGPEDADHLVERMIETVVQARAGDDAVGVEGLRERVDPAKVELVDLAVGDILLDRGAQSAVVGDLKTNHAR